MTRSKKNSIGARVLVLAALGAAALLALTGLASAADSNHDRIPDRWEHHNHLSLSGDQAGRDQDHDGLRNRAEFRTGNDPRDNDTDGDGVMDGNENAGTIGSFDATSGRLVINLFGGDTVSGLVTAGTEIKCEGAGTASTSIRSHGESEPGDDNGGHGEAEPGDDHGDHGTEPGDDNGGNGTEPGDDNGVDTPGSEDHGRHHHRGHVNCTSAALVSGAVVREADLEVEHGQASFDEVELAG